MVCKECGKEIPEGALYCESCGASLDEPVVLKVSKEDIKRAGKEEKVRNKERAKAAAEAAKKQPKISVKPETHKPDADLSKKIDIEGYFRSIGSDMNTLLAFLGAIALYLAPFLNWIFERVFDVKRKANLFEIGMKSSMVEEDGSVLAAGATIVLVLGVVAILIGIWMLLLSGADYIARLRKYAANPLMRFLPIVLMVVIFVVVINNKTYVQSLNALEKSRELAKSIGNANNYDAGRGIGPVVYVAGLVVYTIGTIGDFINHKKKNS